MDLMVNYNEGCVIRIGKIMKMILNFEILLVCCIVLVSCSSKSLVSVEPVANTDSKISAMRKHIEQLNQENRQLADRLDKLEKQSNLRIISGPPWERREKKQERYDRDRLGSRRRSGSYGGYYVANPKSFQTKNNKPWKEARRRPPVGRANGVKVHKKNIWSRATNSNGEKD